jgi:hypothetical protein
MRRYVFFAGIIFLLLASLTPALAQDGGITLIYFTDNTLGISGLKPDGWTELQPGVFLRGASIADATLILYDVEPDITLEELVPLMLPQLGIDALPEPVGITETAAFSWTVYQFTVEGISGTLSIDLALSETDGKVYILLLQTTPEEYPTLHELIFLPALESAAPAEIISTPIPPYIEEEVSFPNGDITLAGTLTLPETAGQHPAVILITGSGAEDRDESLAPIAQIKPFRLIADHLTRNGIAVLRYDDRGVGGSTGDYASATTADFAADAEAALNYLLTRPDINPQQIGLLGHSEGGLAVSMIASRNPDVAFAISMAGPGVPGDELLLLQNRLILEANDISEEEIQHQLALLQALFDATLAGDEALMEQSMAELITFQYGNLSEEERAALGNPDDLDEFIEQMTATQMRLYKGWMAFFLAYDPAEDWAKTTIPVLGLFGGKDIQVDAEQNAPPLEAALQAAGNTDYQIVIFPNANHLFQEAETGNIDEYGTLAQEFTPDFLPTITEWLLARVTVVE